MGIKRPDLTKEEVFGKYVTIPTGFTEDKHIYKVVGSHCSNCYCDIPITYQSETPTIHSQMANVLNVIHCGVEETKVLVVREKDVNWVERYNDSAYWIPHMNTNGTDEVVSYTCSNCSEEAIFTNNEEFVLSKFCPYCGKYMNNHE